MEKVNNSIVWMEAGYDLFAEEGLEGLQIERLARILQLNKSGFYHYFGDLELYCDELLKLHKAKADLYLDAVRKAKTIDPDYFQILIDFSIPVMFHTQLSRLQDKPSYYNLFQKIDQETTTIVRQLWSAYLGVENHPELAMRYFSIIRDTFYSRISFQNLNISFLRGLLGEARDVINELVEHKDKIETGESRFLPRKDH